MPPFSLLPIANQSSYDDIVGVYSYINSDNINFIKNGRSKSRQKATRQFGESERNTDLPSDFETATNKVEITINSCVENLLSNQHQEEAIDKSQSNKVIGTIRKIVKVEACWLLATNS